jgi:TetR/AcrR family transcriptional regulator, transcriptional repressor for nem operon
MARPRSFEPNDVLDAARDLFWSRGYEGTSLDDITRATGVNKPSLFAAFGDKASLFHAVLDRYHEMLLTHARRSLGGDGSARAAVRAWLSGFLPACSGEKGRRGCLSANAGVAPPDVGVADRVAAYNASLETLLRKALERGRKAGEFASGFDVRGAARALLAAQIGLMILARQQPTVAETKAAVERILSILA